MENVISVVALCISFVGVLSSFIFSYKKVDKEKDDERELNIKTMTTIKDNVQTMTGKVDKIDDRIENIDKNMANIDKKIVEHDVKIKNLENEVFKKGGK